MQIVVDGLLTTYQSTGKTGSSILFLHGWADSHKTFEKLENKLCLGHRNISLDLPGFGQTQAPDGVWGLSDYCSYIVKFLAKINMQNIDVIIGHSNGGALGIKLVGDKYVTPSKLILLSSAGIRDRNKVRKIGYKVVAKTGKVATFWLPKSSKQKLQKKLYGTIGSDMLVTPELKETFKKTVSEDIQSDARKINIPTLIIYGDQDKATPPEFGNIFQKLISGSELHIVEGASHFLHHEKPDEVADLIEGFIE